MFMMKLQLWEELPELPNCFIVKRSQFDSHSQAEDAITRSMESLEPIR